MSIMLFNKDEKFREIQQATALGDKKAQNVKKKRQREADCEIGDKGESKEDKNDKKRDLKRQNKIKAQKKKQKSIHERFHEYIEKQKEKQSKSQQKYYAKV